VSVNVPVGPERVMATELPIDAAHVSHEFVPVLIVGKAPGSLGTNTKAPARGSVPAGSKTVPVSVVAGHGAASLAPSALPGPASDPPLEPVAPSDEPMVASYPDPLELLPPPDRRTQIFDSHESPTLHAPPVVQAHVSAPTGHEALSAHLPPHAPRTPNSSVATGLALTPPPRPHGSDDTSLGVPASPFARSG